MELFEYPIDKVIQYTNNREYRHAVRTLVSMAPRVALPEEEGEGDLDEVTQDELDYEEEAASAFLDAIYRHTRNHPTFLELYTLSAGVMLSEDAEIGLAVMFSYDYLGLFHACLCDFFTHGDPDPEPYAMLRRALTRTRTRP